MMPDVEPFLNFMDQFVQLDEANRALLSSKLRTKKYAKGQLIHLQGEICDRIIFIVKGQARSYYTDFTGKTFTWHLHFNDADAAFVNFFPIDYHSYLTQTPSQLNVEALTDIEAVVIDHKDSEEVKPVHIDFERQTKLATEAAYKATHNRLLSLLTLSATQRYEQLLANEPYLLTKFANHYIASYLGITAQSLSRIRGEQ